MRGLAKSYGPRRALDGVSFTAPVAGKVGVWSKTDSISEFADYVVTP